MMMSRRRVLVILLRNLIHLKFVASLRLLVKYLYWFTTISSLTSFLLPQSLKDIIMMLIMTCGMKFVVRNLRVVGSCFCCSFSLSASHISQLYNIRFCKMLIVHLCSISLHCVFAFRYFDDSLATEEV